MMVILCSKLPCHVSIVGGRTRTTIRSRIPTGLAKTHSSQPELVKTSLAAQPRK